MKRAEQGRIAVLVKELRDFAERRERIDGFFKSKPNELKVAQNVIASHKLMLATEREEHAK